jgi:hypothetical protein
MLSILNSQLAQKDLIARKFGVSPRIPPFIVSLLLFSFLFFFFAFLFLAQMTARKPGQLTQRCAPSQQCY